MKPLDELIERQDPAMLLVQDLLENSSQHYQLLPPCADNDRVLLGLQVTTRSTLGAIAHQTGGLLIDHGWLRIFGSGHPELPRNILDWSAEYADGHLLVADDAVGGVFSINGGALGDDLGALYYWAPDTLAWEALEIGYSDFLGWVLSEQFADFYQDLRWAGWAEDLKSLGAEHCFAFFPFLFSAEGSVHTSSRKAISVAEHYRLNVGAAQR